MRYHAIICLDVSRGGEKTQSIYIWTILTVAALFDAKSYRIPNELIGLGYVAGLFLNIEQFQVVGIAIFIIKAAWPIALLFLLYKVKGLGAGDIKLFSVLSGMWESKLTAEVMIASVMLAGVAVLLLFLYEKQIDLKRRLHYSFYITGAFFCLQFV